MTDLIKTLSYRTDVKLGFSIILVSLANFLFFESPIGATIGLFCLLLLGGISFFRPQLRHQSKTRILLLGAALTCASMIESANYLQFLFFLGLCFALVVLPKLRTRLPIPAFILLGLKLASIIWYRALDDIIRILGIGAKRQSKTSNFKAIFSAFAMPVVMAIIFSSLFLIANPILEKWISQIQFPQFEQMVSFPRIAFSIFVLSLSWFFIRPRFKFKFFDESARTRPINENRPIFNFFFNETAVFNSLFLFNAIFLVQNGMDIGFLWSGAHLPDGVTYAQYAHRGAYPLILTSLMAGGFVLFSLENVSRKTKFLVYAWIVQNIFLVASSILRTMKYVEVYSLTQMRLAAMIWMGLVAIGLALIIIRIAFKRDSAFLINANALVLISVLSLCSFANFSALIAKFNVQHCYEISGQGNPLDIAYLRELGVDALPSIIWARDKLLTNQKSQNVSNELAKLAQDTDKQLRANVGDWRAITFRQYRLSNQIAPL